MLFKLLKKDYNPTGKQPLACVIRNVKYTPQHIWHNFNMYLVS